MSIYAISDLHLGFSEDKPMDIFGDIWHNHTEKIKENWDSIVSDKDTVLVCGDLSWARTFSDADEDLRFLHERKGHKILIRGNHDFWWHRNAFNKISKLMPPDITLLQGSSIKIGSVGIAGTRGWRDEQSPDKGEKVILRELAYLERALESIQDCETKIVMMHFPPFDLDMTLNRFAQMIKSYGTNILVYGHIHNGESIEGDVDGVQYRLVAVDHIGFKPVRIITTTR